MIICAQLSANPTPKTLTGYCVVTTAYYQQDPISIANMTSCLRFHSHVAFSLLSDEKWQLFDGLLSRIQHDVTSWPELLEPKSLHVFGHFTFFFFLEKQPQIL